MLTNSLRARHSTGRAEHHKLNRAAVRKVCDCPCVIAEHPVVPCDDSCYHFNLKSDSCAHCGNKRATRRVKSLRGGWTWAKLCDEAGRVLGGDAQDDRRIGGMMLLALLVGARKYAIQRHIPDWDSVLNEAFTRLRKNGVFSSSGDVNAAWFDEHGGLAFCADVNVARGLLARERGGAS